MAEKKRKNVGMRGSRTHGYGSHKKHRGAGSRGGRGMAGAKRHMKTWFIKNNPGHLGKRGFKSLEQRKMKRGVKAINVRDLESLAAGKKELDMGKLGYDKVIGGGTIKVALSVKAGYFTPKAREKIEQAKGKAIGGSAETEAATGTDEAEKSNAAK